jgi:hypothetical protein
MGLTHGVDEVYHTFLELVRALRIQEDVGTSGVLDYLAQIVIQYGKLRLSEVAKSIEATIRSVLVALTYALIHEPQDRFNERLVLLGLLLLHVLDVVEERNEALHRLCADVFVGISHVVDKEREE